MSLRELNIARANMYNMLSNLYCKEVDNEFLEQMSKMKFPKDCKQQEMEEGYRYFESYLSSRTEQSYELLASDFAKVFLGAGVADKSAAFPYESVYTSLKHLIKQESWSKVRNIYAARGMHIETDTSDLMEDHISYELAYMAILCNEADSTEQIGFLENHLLNWVPYFCNDIQKYVDTDFYKALGKLTVGWLKMDLESLQLNEEIEDGFSCEVITDEFDKILMSLSEKYVVYGPKMFEGRGSKNNSDLVRYAPINSIEDIVTNIPSDFSPKEIFYPITQVMLYFNGNEYEESIVEEKKDIIIFARPCDINAVRRLDKIFLENGQATDIYYQRMREKVKFVLLECNGGWDTCFCVSMGSNIAENYSIAVRKNEDKVMVKIKDTDLINYFNGGDRCDFSPEFVHENKRVINIPDIENSKELKLASNLEFWEQYNDQCIGCGGCNTVCPTCSCFDTVDIIYDETSTDGERKRVWSSCMLKDFTTTAGGHKARKTPGDNMRFKVLHKIYDYKLRFDGDEHMCVGCGRCDRRCSKKISFYDTICGFTKALEQEVKKNE